MPNRVVFRFGSYIDGLGREREKFKVLSRYCSVLGGRGCAKTVGCKNTIIDG